MGRIERVIGAIRHGLGVLVAVGCLVLAGALLVTWAAKRAAPPDRTALAGPVVVAAQSSAPAPALAPAPAPAQTPASCTGTSPFAAAATANQASLNTATLAPFGVPEDGWAIYAPLIGREIGAPCAPETSDFAAALARWQGSHGLASTGRVDAPALSAMAVVWLLRRPFVRAMKTGCPPPPAEQALAQAAPDEAYGGKIVRARAAALAAFGRMRADARAALGLSPPLLTIASAYRGPDEEAARCADGGCGTAAKAHCSAHRTGLAFDLYLGAAPGHQPFSTANADRLYQSRTPAYHWLVANADRYGFLPYPFEPWHWEWTGEGV